MPSELETKAFETDMRAREVLLRLLKHKEEIDKALQKDDVSVLEEERLGSMRAEIDSQIAQYRFSGIF